MNRLNGFSMAGALALGAAAVFARPFGSEGEAEGVRGPEDLREELRRAQFAAPPSEGLLAYEAGPFLFLPDGSDPDGDRFAEGLLSDAGVTGAWPVTVFEDRETRGTVFLNADGAEILRLPPEPEYAESWVLDALYPEGGVPADAAAGYDPARVVMAGRLLFPGAVETEGADGDPNEGVSSASGPARAFGGAVPSVGRAAGSVAIAGGVMPNAFRGEWEMDRDSKRRGPQTWYVDSDLGRDSNDGRSPVAQSGGRGPRASVQKAIDAAASDDVIEVCGQAALPDALLRPGGKRIHLRPQGSIRF